MTERIHYPGALSEFRNFLSGIGARTWDKAFEPSPGDPDFRPGTFIATPANLDFLTELQSDFPGVSYWQFELMPFFALKSLPEDFAGPIGCALIHAQQVRSDETLIDCLDGMGFFEPGGEISRRGPECHRLGTPPPPGRRLHYFPPAGDPFCELVKCIRAGLSESKESISPGLPAVKDPVDLDILEICLPDPDIINRKLCMKINKSLKITQGRRHKLKEMGYKVY